MSDKKPLDRQDLDAMGAHGCADPNCRNHGRHTHVLYMHQECHRLAPMFVEVLEGVATFRCSVPPFDIVTKVNVDSVRLVMEGAGFDSHGMLEQPCDEKTSGMRVSYQHDSGILVVSCYWCKRTVAEVVVVGAVA